MYVFIFTSVTAVCRWMPVYSGHQKSNSCSAFAADAEHPVQLTATTTKSTKQSPHSIIHPPPPSPLACHTAKTKYLCPHPITYRAIFLGLIVGAELIPYAKQTVSSHGEIRTGLVSLQTGLSLTNEANLNRDRLVS